MPAVAILAAGQGKRMGNPHLAKVLTPLDGRPLLGYVLEQAMALGADPLVVIVGHQREAVEEYVRTTAPAAVCVTQHEQRGTGHAVLQTRPVLDSLDTDVLILSGDVPLLRAETLARLQEHHTTSEAALTVLTTTMPDPTGYGRIVRDEDARLRSIVEQKDASDADKTIAEINSGIYLVRSRSLFSALDRVTDGNAQGEYYLTDIVGILLEQGERVEALMTTDWQETQGINTIADLERASVLRSQMAERV